MVVTKVFSHSDDQALTNWNEQLKKCCNFNVFSLYQWGQYKSASWNVERLTFHLENTQIGQAQILFKHIGPFKVGWCSSGINLTNYKYLPEIVQSLEAYYSDSKTYLRFNFLDQATGEVKFAFDEISSLQQVEKTINSGYTIRFYDLVSKSLDPANYDRNTRYYLKKAKENNLAFSIEDFEVNTFSQVHTAMAESKGLENLKTNTDDLISLQKQFGSHLKMALVKKDGSPLAACLLIIFEDFAYYYLAGSTDNGRKLNASFFMIDELLKHFKENLKIKEFDFGGITPFKDNAKGVNRFKLGYNGTTVNYIGERVICKNSLLKKLFDFIIYKKLN